ncbi:MAG: metallophosphoesterase, partial [Gammaproteobacteria bacterium]
MRFVRAFPLIPAMAWLSIMLNACSLDCKEEREVMILGINDVYRIEGVDGQKTGGMGRVRALRKELEQKFPDLLFLHAGDFLFPSLLSDWSKGAHMINTMNALDGVGKGYDSQMLVVFGNHEFDKTKINDAANLQQLINRSEFDWLGSNVVFTEQDG